MSSPDDDASFRSLYEDAPCGLVLTEADGTIVRANRTFVRWCGIDEATLVANGRRFQDLLTMGGRIFHQTHWSPLLAMQGSVAEVKFDLVGASGTSMPIVMNAIRRERDGRAMHELAIMLADDRHKYERELMQARKRAEQLLAEQADAQRALAAAHEAAHDRALFAEQMMGIVSHDLRNPLSAILLGSSLMTRAELQPPFDRAILHVKQAAERAQRLIGDLLDFTVARIGRGIQVTTRPIDLHETVATAVNELTIAHPTRRIVHQAFGEGACEADPDRIVQLIGNLVSNAVAYGDPEGEITVTSRVDAPRCRIDVHNFGPAIPSEQIARLFQPMVRGEGGALQRNVGLGLFIVSELARAHGGGVAVESNPLAGTRFSFDFPQARAPVSVA